MRNVDELLAGDKTLLLVDDDKAFLTRLARAMEKRGFEVRTGATKPQVPSGLRCMRDPQGEEDGQEGGVLLEVVPGARTQRGARARPSRSR